MVPMEKLAAMDAKGILPYNSESADTYLHRCYRMLTLAADPLWVRRFMDIHLQSVCDRNDFVKGYFPAPDTPRIATFREGIRRFGQLTRSDLSWIPVFGFTEKLGRETCAGIQVDRGSGEQNIPMQMLGVNTQASFFPYSVTGTGAHESFHAIRSLSIHDSGEYDHLGHLMIEWWQKWTPVTDEQKEFFRAWLKLRWYFGTDAWYVLVRLSYDEVVENILGTFQGRNPREYLQWAAQHHLRERIMCHRLGL